MKMCCNAYDVSLAFNALSFVFLLIAGFVFSDSQVTSVSGEEVSFESELDNLELQKSDSPSALNAAWFGPRMGRKKRSPRDEGSFDLFKILRNFFFSEKQSPEADLDSYLQLLKNYPKLAALVIKEKAAQDELVKPRYGRGDSWSDGEERMIIKTPPFSPRLGRRSLLPYKPRTGRTGNDASSIYKPRLGRGHYGFNEFYPTNIMDEKNH